MKRSTSFQLQKSLLAWFDVSARKLPFRGGRDPYAVWLSEIMLQQTQVATVVPYFERFIRRYPTVGKLAAARLDSVLKLWQGLGYYGRARNLHKAAGVIVSEYGGVFPDTVDGLMTLPGIGRYTAGAIASIAFGRRVAVLDGNVMRVLCRLYRLDDNPKSPAAQQHLWQLAENLVPEKRPGDFNQSLMELGATVCTPKNPNCPQCPVQKLCLAFVHDEQDVLPRMPKAAPTPHHTVAVGLVFKNGTLLIDKRKPEGLLGGLWELPGGKKQKNETLKQAVAREIKEEIGIDAAVGKRLCVVRHAYSHFRITLHTFRCDWVDGTAKPLHCAAVKWIKPKDIGKYAFPAATLKIFEAVKASLADVSK
jgi:A/G-specific adenine glycosylase